MMSGIQKDRSTAVVGGPSPLAPDVIGMREFEELPQGLSGNARADALAMIDRRYHKALIIADLSYDPSYADILVERFGERVIGLHITSTGDTIDNWEERQLKRGRILVYKVSRTLSARFIAARNAKRDGSYSSWRKQHSRL